MLREHDESDRAFIVSGWSSSLRMTRDISMIRMTSWAQVMRPEIEAFMARPGVRAIVACGSERDARHGFICFEEPAYVAYVYVAQPYRRRGIARLLFDAAGIDPLERFGYACRTKSSWMLRSKVPMAIYDPFKARFAPGEKT